MEKLETSVQISILKGAIRRLKYDKEFWGCCNAIIVSSVKLHSIMTDCSQLESQFPLFNREKALSLSKTKGFKEPDLFSEFWWQCGKDRQARIKFLTALVEELEQTL